MGVGLAVWNRLDQRAVRGHRQHRELAREECRPKKVKKDLSLPGNACTHSVDVASELLLDEHALTTGDCQSRGGCNRAAPPSVPKGTCRSDWCTPVLPTPTGIEQGTDGHSF